MQDVRWIATADCQIKESPHVPGDWRVESGSLICEMRDTLCQPHDANLIATAPELLAACEMALEILKGEMTQDEENFDMPPVVVDRLEAAIEKAKGQ